MSEQIDLKHVEVMSLQPDDVIVFRAQGALSHESAVRVKQLIQEATNHERVLVIDRGSEIAAIRPAPKRSLWQRLRDAWAGDRV